MADLLDILDEAEAKRAAFGTDAAAAAHTEQVARAITAVSRRIDALVGPVVQRTVTEYHNGGSGSIYPYKTPVVSVTTVTEWNGSTQTALTADTWGTAGAANGYATDGAGHVFRILRQTSGYGSTFLAGDRSVRLVYEAGRFATTADVDPLFKEAAAEVLRRLWNREAGAWARGADPFDTGDGMGTSRLFRAVDYVVDELLAHEKPPPAVA